MRGLSRQSSGNHFLNHRINPVIAVGCTGMALTAALAVQFGVPYLASTAFFVVVLAAIFAIGYASEKTLSIHSVNTWRREVFYWATVIATFALGTAAGDMTAVTIHLGYLTSGVMFAALFAIPALAYRFIDLNAVLSFWFAYVITRPLGASFADWMGVSRAVER